MMPEKDMEEHIKTCKPEAESRFTSPKKENMPKETMPEVLPILASNESG
jgi:hypothetical protein